MRQLPIISDFVRPTGEAAPDASPTPSADRERFLPHVVAWNVTKRCNLECSHCYISAGSWQAQAGELTTDECRRIADEIIAVNPAPLFVLSGGEPLVRGDLEDIARHAFEGGATVVVGTNGIGLTDERIASLKDAGVTGVAVSVDSLDATYHDRFRHGEAALDDTLAAIERLRKARLDFIVQTTVTKGNRQELNELVRWSADRGAVSFNLYFLVATGRAEHMSGLSAAENEEVLSELVDLSREYRGRMMVRSKCQPALMRHVVQRDPESPLLNYNTRCPCGQQYCRITPEGKLTPCPYNPDPAGDLRERSFADVWWKSSLLARLRTGELGGKCGRCEYREICGGCRARAFAEGGDVMGADESCAFEPTGDVPVVSTGRDVTYGMPSKQTLPWTPEAEARMRRVPSFVRGVVMRRVEDYAARNGHDVVSEGLLAEVRSKLPVDFSRRLPFFLRKDDESSD